MNEESNKNIGELFKNSVKTRKNLVAVVMLVLVVIVIVTIATSLKKPLNVRSVSPPNNASEVSIHSRILVVFNRELSPNEEASISLSSTPLLLTTQQLLSDKKSILLAPSSTLKLKQTYTLTLRYANEAFIWIFTTASLDSNLIKEQVKSQAKISKELSQYWSTITKNYPWFDQYLKTKDFFVYFDIANKQFVAKLYPDPSALSAVDAQVNLAKKIISAWIHNLGNNASSFPVRWVIKPV